MSICYFLFHLIEISVRLRPRQAEIHENAPTTLVPNSPCLARTPRRRRSVLGWLPPSIPTPRLPTWSPVTLSVLPPEAELLELIFLHLSADEISSMRTLG